MNARSEEATRSSPPKPLASWYAQGLSDGLGDRLLMFDNSDAPSLELLRFHPHLAQAPGFETALRDQVHRFARFHHPAFARVRSVQRLEPDDDLALISNYTPGKRLSEILHRTQGAAFAAALIRQLAPALTLFQQHAAGATHGVLDPDRIVVSPEGRLTIVEHVIGRAIGTLGDSQLASIGVALPPGENGAPTRSDAASDWYQLGLVALSVLMGRPVEARDLPQLDTLLDELESSEGPDGTRLSPFFRQWLARALQLSGDPIATGADGRAALEELIQKDRPGDTRRIEGPNPQHASPASPRNASGEPPAVEPPQAAADNDHQVVPGTTAIDLPESELFPAAEQRPSPAPAPPIERPVIEARRPEEKSQRPPQAPRADPLSMFEKETLAAKIPPVEFRTVAPVHVPSAATPHPRQNDADRRMFAAPVVAALALLALAEAGVIGWLARTMWLTPHPAVVSETTAAGENLLVRGEAPKPNALRLTVAPDLSWARITAPLANGLSTSKTTEVTTGSIRISSPIELKVLEGSRLLGSVPGGDIKLAAGRHEISLVNAALGYRLSQAVDVEAGQMVSLHIAAPHGLVTIDASPWAEVTIDGRAVGRTPLGPLPLALGEHEIVFRNPAGSNDRQRVTIKPDGVTRVVGNLRF